MTSWLAQGHKRYDMTSKFDEVGITLEPRKNGVIRRAHANNGAAHPVGFVDRGYVKYLQGFVNVEPRHFWFSSKCYGRMILILYTKLCLAVRGLGLGSIRVASGA